MDVKVAFCDDEIEEIRKIKEYVELVKLNTDIKIQVEYFTSSEILLQKYTRETNPFDLVFLDMEMPTMSGLDVAKQIRHKGNRETLIIFMTSYPKYMQQSFNVQAFQYLIKPVDYKVFQEELLKAVEYLQGDESSLMFMTKNNEEVCCRLRDVYYFEKKKGTTFINIAMRQGEIEIRANIADIEEELSKKDFIRISRSCIVNMSYILLFRKDMLQLTEGQVIPISRRKIKEVKETFAKYAVLGGLR